MGYVRDDRTGKFTWVDGPVEDGASPFDAAATSAQASRGVPTLNVTHVAIALAVIGVVAFAGWRAMDMRKEPLVDIRRIHTRPGEYEGRVVRVRGRIGQVFPMGDSYAYYLLQGRDTIVVYTRGDRPKPSDGTVVCGSVTIGYLDGSVRPALFQRRE